MNLSLRSGGKASFYLKAAGIVPLLLALAACAKEAPPSASAAAAAPAAKPPSPAGPQLAAPAPKAAPVSPGGAHAAPATPPQVDAALLKQGEEIFQSTCATCHMADGGGVPNMQPSIIGSGWISAPDPQLLLSLILRGAVVMGAAANAYDNKMPPLDHLSDTEIAAVATYVRGHFAGTPITVPVTPAEVAVARARPGLPQ